MLLKPSILFLGIWILNIDNNFFDSMVNPSELQLNKANVSYTNTSFFWIYIYQYRMVLSRLKFMINEMILILIS